MVETSEKAEECRAIVRRVLTALGYESTYRNFRLWDPLLDWHATAKLMDRPPTRTVLCHVLDQRGQIVKCEGRPVVVAEEIVACSETEAAKILKKQSKVFVRWW
jgi:hypothetical protein